MTLAGERSRTLSDVTGALGYTTREVASLLGASPQRIRALARAGCVAPERGRRSEYRFGFADIVLLRTALELAASGVSPSRIRASLDALADQLPQGRPLTAVRIEARGGEVVVSDGSASWEPATGQGVFDFSVAELAAEVAPIADARAGALLGQQPLGQTAEEWFEIGLDLEAVVPDRAAEAYRRALELDPDHAEANVNLGRLLHEAGDTAGALELARRAEASAPDLAEASYNLGVALQDLGRLDEAAAAYRRALETDPDLADAHYNLATVCERLGDNQGALAHLIRFRRLSDHG